DPPSKFIDGPPFDITRGDGASGSHGHPSIRDVIEIRWAATCRTISIAAWLLEMIGIPSLLCSSSIASIARQFVHERKTQSGAHPSIWDSTKLTISEGGILQ